MNNYFEQYLEPPNHDYCMSDNQKEPIENSVPYILEQERKSLTDSINAKYSQIEHLKTFIHWDKKRLKLVTDQLEELLSDHASKTLTDISKNLK